MKTKFVKAQDLKRFDRINYIPDVVYIVDNVMIGPSEVVVQYSYLGTRQLNPLRYRIDEWVAVNDYS